MPNLDRFPAPTTADNKARCQGGCQRVLHYEELDDNGLCEDCQPDEEDETLHPDPAG